MPGRMFRSSGFETALTNSIRLTSGGFGQKISGRTLDTSACLAQPLITRQTAAVNAAGMIYR